MWKYEGDLKYNFQGYIKCKVYTTPPASIGDLKQRIIGIFDSLKRDPFMIRRAVKDMVRRSNMCIRERGCHVERLLENK